MMILIKTQIVILLLKKLPTLTSCHFPIPKDWWTFRSFPCPLTQLFQLPFCTCGQGCAHFCITLSLPPVPSGFFQLGLLNSWEPSAAHFIFFYLGFSIQLEKIRLISSVPFMLLGKPFYSSLVDFPSHAPPRCSDPSSLTSFQHDSPCLILRIWPHGFISQKYEGIQHKLLQFCSFLNPSLLASLSPDESDKGSRIIFALSQNQLIHLYIWSQLPSSSGNYFINYSSSSKSSVFFSPLHTVTIWWSHTNEQQTFLLPSCPFKPPPYPIPGVFKLLEKWIFIDCLCSSAVSHSSNPHLLTSAFLAQCSFKGFIPLILLQESTCLRRSYPSLKVHLKCSFLWIFCKS